MYAALKSDVLAKMRCYEAMVAWLESAMIVCMVVNAKSRWSQVTGNYDGLQLLILEQMHCSILTDM